MSYLALARKYRPQTFDELVGQEFVSTSLKNAIALQRVSHAYLFTGARGVGKTSAARIFAKALNCLNPVDSNPCNICEHCLEITNGTSMDVVEIDAASNRGIDEIRQLREAVKFIPVKYRHKVYIIDEFHMLTDQASNALLKTLEEPPEYTVFIFATTDAHKILKTILSRCQRYDFKKIPFDDMHAAVQAIFQKEKIAYDQNALNLIVRQSEGCMRDALSFSDQIISYTEGNVAYPVVARMMGMGEDHLIEELFGAVLEENVAPLENLVERLSEAGVSYLYGAEKMVEHTRNLMLIRKGGSHLRKSLTSDEIAFYGNLKATDHRLFALFQLFQKLHNDLKYSSFGRYTFEFALYKAVRLSQIVPLPLPENEEIPAAAPAEDAKSKPSAARDKKPPPAAKEDIPVPSTFSKLESRWHELLQDLRKEAPDLAALLQYAALLEYGGEKVRIGFPPERVFPYSKVIREENRKSLHDFLKRKLGDGVSLEIQNGGEKKKPLIDKKQELESLHERQLKEEAVKLPVVQHILKSFGIDSEDLKVIKK